MEEEESASTKMRIYVGGLGASMTEDDLRKVFQSVGGVVEAVDFIRSKSRSFAYVDFFPSSQSSISKLFSTYNGCAWKGGKLRLEKAKEHYLARLRREWEEDAEIMNYDDGADLETSAPESTEHVAKSEHIQIFFPSLGEVKSFPVSGTGTHKYDFPHVEVPPLPVHFCDCEEHNVSDPTGKSMDTKTGDLDAGNGGIDEDEIKMMNTVLNKLFERQEASHANCNGTMAVKDKDNSKILTDNQPLEDNKEDSDEDNLVLNVMASGSNSKPLPLNSGSKSFKAHGNSKGAARDQKGNSRVQSKKRKSVTNEEFDGNEYVPNISTGSGKGNTNPAYEPVGPSRPQAPDQAMPIQSSRSQKSSWKTLICDKSKASFSISDILPSVPSANEEQPEADDLSLAHSSPNRNSDRATAAVLKRKKDKTKPANSNVSFSILDTLPTASSADQEQTEAADPNRAHSTPNRNSDLATAAVLKRKKDETKPANSNVSFCISDALPTASSADQEQTEAEDPNLAATDAILESKSKEMKSVESSPEAENTIPNVTSNKGRGAAWKKKSSWTQLVSQEATSFSITQILSNNTSEKQVQRESDVINVNLFAPSENNDSIEQESRSTAADESAAFVIAKDETACYDVKKNDQPAVQENEPSPTEVIERHIKPQEAGSFDAKSVETCCPFMRNSRSVAEWTKIKAALSGGSKKKKQRQLDTQ
ncbi:uncharacterized protein LOC111499238 [Cucurbita maxima]|uniref:Uncharacterized protein LOC111499238 n=1 Tax=Cucurbita maxima TaxID=3661 RepID=A0A6J1KY23_CUCMA|nr:uncharacterized protein LOC111499238 [Cucurbita maxima]